MKGRTLAALAVVAFLVVGYAVYQTTRSRDAPARTPKKVAKADKEPERKPTKKRKPAGDKPDKPRPKGAPAPPPPKPNMTVEEAREQFDDYIAELDREALRGEEVGRQLSNEAWVDLYKQGHDAIRPLQQLLDHSDPVEGKELNEKMELMRRKLWNLQPRSEPQ